MVASPYRVLIVDNHRIFRQGLRLLLERSGDIQVIGDTDAHHSLTLAMTTKPAVILMDLRLPQFDDGSRILSQLRESVPEAHIVVLTAQGDELNSVYNAI